MLHECGSYYRTLITVFKESFAMTNTNVFAYFSGYGFRSKRENKSLPNTD